MTTNRTGADYGYTYTGDTGNAYRVTMLKRDVKRGTAHVRIDSILALPDAPAMPLGIAVTVPLRKVVL